MNIENAVKAKNITSILHFTNVENLDSILRNGLLSRQVIENRSMLYSFNDSYRGDGVLNAICCSISFPNYKMFYQLQKKNPDIDWAVISINPSVLWEKKCEFFSENAAKKNTSAVPFDKLFSDIHKRHELSIPDSYTTNPQAEVLVLDVIEPKYFSSINFNEKLKIKNPNKISDIIKPFQSRFEFKINRDLFTYRKDYTHWLSEKSSLYANNVTFNLGDLVF